MQHTIKDHIEGSASFVYFRDGALWYRTAVTGLLFPVPVEDVASAQVLATERGIFFMRWIRKYLSSLS